MGFLTWVLLGLVAGVLAKMIMPGDDRMGCVVTIALGVLGAIVGGGIGNALGFGDVTSFDIRSVGLAVLGAMLLLGILRMTKRRAP